MRTLLPLGILGASLCAGPLFAQEAPAPPPPPPAPTVERITGHVEEELAHIFEVHERYTSRMDELVEDVRQVARARRDEELQKITRGYQAKRQELEETERLSRSLAMRRFEAFLAKYPFASHTPAVMFRLAELYVEQAIEEWQFAAEEYNRLEIEAQGDVAIELPPSPTVDYSNAIALYKGILDDHPDYEFRDGAWYMLGISYYDDLSTQLDPESAREAFSALVEFHPDSVASVDASMRLGEYYFDENQLETAITYYTRVVERGEEDNTLYDSGLYKLGWAHYKLSNYDVTLDLFTRLLDRSSEVFMESGRESNLAPEAIEYMAISFSDLADIQGGEPREKAEEWFNRVGEREFEHKIYDRLADVLVQQARFEQAIDTYAFLQTRWPLHPNNPGFQQKIAELYAAPPFPDQAMAAEALVLLGERYKEGSAWWESNRSNPEALAEARGYIEKSLVMVATEFHLRAQESGTREDYSLAADKYREYLDSFPFADDYLENQWLMAASLFDSARYEDAIVEYEKLISSNLDSVLDEDKRAEIYDGARWQLVKAWNQILVNRFGKVDSRAEDAVVEGAATSAAGRERAIYQLADEQASFVAAADSIRSEDFTHEAYSEALDNNRPALHYQPAQLLYEHGRYEEARPRLEEIVDLFPETDEGLYAASLLVDSFLVDGDMANVKAYSDRFARMTNLGASEDLSEEKQLFFSNQREGAAFKLAGELQSAGDLVGAGDAFLAFLDEFPDSQYAPKALFNAGSNFDNAGKVERANALFEQFINTYPDDPQSEQLYAWIAGNYANVLELEQAIEYYESLSRYFPDSERAADAMLNAAQLKIGVGQHEGAARSLEEFAREFPEDDQAETAFWMAGEQWELVSDDRGLAFYRRYLDRYVDTNPDHSLEALHWIAEYYERQGNSSRADRAWRELIDRFGSLSNLPDSQVGQRSRTLAAKAAFRDVQVLFDEFIIIRYTGDGEQDATLLTETKRADMQALEEAALDIVSTYGDFEYTTAAFHTIGAAFLAYAEMLYDAPIPDSLIPRGADEETILFIQDSYTGVLRDLATPLEDKAVARFEANLARAEEAKRSSVWIDRTMAALNSIRPRSYALEKGEARGQAVSIVLPVGGPQSATEEEEPEEVEEIEEAEEPEEPEEEMGPNAPEDTPGLWQDSPDSPEEGP